MTSARRLRRAGPAVALGAACAAFATGGWVVIDRLEQDDDFCNACHLPSGERLHRDVRREYDARPPVSLAALHAGERVAGRADPAFRCIDCHGGSGALGRLRVKTLAAKDAFWYAVGRFEEPDGMRWPLWDEDCSKCHPSFAAARERGEAAAPFHALAVHNAALGVDCVECHRAHGPGGDPDAWFLHADHVRSRCAICHSEFEEG